MISRKSARLIGQLYSIKFQQGVTLAQLIQYETLYNFLYEREYEAWFLNTAQTWMQRNHSVESGIMKLHTGESIVSATKDSSWDYRRQLGQALLKKLAEDILPFHANKAVGPIAYKPCTTAEQRKMVDSLNESRQKPYNLNQTLRKQLEIDGYIYRDGILYYSESSVIPEQEEQSILELLIKNLPLNDKAVILNHLNLSEEHYLNSKWGDSISNARNFLEAILEKAAHSIHSKKNLTSQPPDRPAKVREFLEQEGFIGTTEREAIAKVYGLISNTGSHPNLAEQDEARLMRHLALTFSQYILLTLEAYLKNNP